MATLPKLRSQSPLAIRLLVTILITSTLITSIMIIIQLYAEYHSDVGLIKQRMHQIKESYRSSIAISVWNFDRKQYETQLDGILHFQDIVYTEIRSLDDQLILSRGSAPAARYIREEVDLVTTDFSRAVQPGKLVIVASLQRVYDNLFYRGMVILLTQGIKTFVISFVILFSFYWMVTRYLYHIADYARQIDINSNEKLKINRNNNHQDELDYIVFAINDMKEKIKANYQTIADLNQTLEHKVEARTRELQESNDKFRYLFHNTIASIAIFQNNHCVDLNSAGIALFGFDTLEDALGLPPEAFVAPNSVAMVAQKIALQDSQPYEATGKRRDGSEFPMLVKGHSALIAGVPSRITSAIDLTQTKCVEEALRRANLELERLSHTDPLTGAYNRRFFTDEAKRLLALAQREGHDTAVVMLDIDDFKEINDHFGHDAGDQVICAVVDLIKTHTRASDLVARFGGEEFVVLLPNTPIGDAHDVAEKIRRQIAANPITPNAKVTVSVGVATFSNDDSDIIGTISRADKALYTAKRHGKNRVQRA